MHSKTKKTEKDKASKVKSNKMYKTNPLGLSNNKHGTISDNKNVALMHTKTHKTKNDKGVLRHITNVNDGKVWSLEEDNILLKAVEK